MNLSTRKITFTFHRADGSVTKTTKEMFGDNDMVQWATQQYAEVNECGVTAHINDQQIAIYGNVQN